VVTNNPQAKFWDDPKPDPVTGKRPHIGNRHYRIADLVRASTAAPYYFEPQPMRIVESEPEGLFVDGGVSPLNNPALQLLMLAGLKGHALNWPIGKDQLLLISIGTGWCRPRLTFDQLRRMTAIEHAARSLRGVAWDSQVQTLKILQWISEPRRPWPIDMEVGSLEGEVLGSGPNKQQALISFQRYDVKLDCDWIEQEAATKLTADDLVRLNNFVETTIMQEVYDIAAKCAAKHVDDADFPAVFDGR
jgi:hypothetical protein